MPRFARVLAALAVLSLASAAFAQRDAPAGRRRGPLRVVVYDARGVGPSARESALAAFADSPRTRARTATPEEIRAGALDDADVVLFTGGQGSVQGRLLGEEGRERVRRFVREGGGYVGICAGSYLAMQGEAEFHKLGLVAARHATGDRWRRGIRHTPVAPSDGSPSVALHYANGPLMAPEVVEGLPPVVVLATFDADVYWERYDTHPGEMPGMPAVIAARHGRGRLLLFSPNPTLEPAHPELLVRAAAWVARPEDVPATLSWADVFGR